MENVKTFSYQEASTIEALIYWQFTKYEKLYELFGPYIRSIGPIVHIYIDLYDMITVLYRYKQYRFIDKPMGLAGCLCNLAIHYRNFFKKFGIYTRVFLIYSSITSPNHLKFCAEYNAKNMLDLLDNTEVKEYINRNIQDLANIAPYLPDIYFRLGTVEPAVMIFDMIEKFKVKGLAVPSYVITKSPFAAQLPVSDPDLIKLLFLVKKKDGEDISYIVNPIDCFKPLIDRGANPLQTKLIPTQPYVAGFLAFNGIRKRSMKAIFNYLQTNRILEILSDMNEVLSPETLFEAYQLFAKDSKPNRVATYQAICERFNCIDLLYQVNLYNTLPESAETMYLRQLNDQESLLRINQKYFKDNPINIDLL